LAKQGNIDITTSLDEDGWICDLPAIKVRLSDGSIVQLREAKVRTLDGEAPRLEVMGVSVPYQDGDVLASRLIVIPRSSNLLEIKADHE